MGSPHWEASWPDTGADSPSAAVEWMQRVLVLALNHVLGQPMLSAHSGQGTDTAQEAGVQPPPGSLRAPELVASCVASWV